MTSEDFIGYLDQFHTERNKDGAVNFFNRVTAFSLETSKKFVECLWGCSKTLRFGHNIYMLLNSSANNEEFIPNLKDGCGIYFFYLDEHAATYALYKISNFKS